METWALAVGNRVRGKSNVVAHSKVVRLRIGALSELICKPKTNGPDPLESEFTYFGFGSNRDISR
jgi:hypothetical protein